MVNGLFFCKLLYLVAVLDLVDKYLRRLEARNVVFFNDDGGVARNVTRDFFQYCF